MSITATFDWERKQGVLIARVGGRIDSIAAYDFEMSVNQNVGDEEKALLFDMQNVSFISSSGLRVCLLTAKRFNSPGLLFGLCSLPTTVAEVMGISGFDQIIPIYRTEQLALEACVGAPVTVQSQQETESDSDAKEDKAVPPELPKDDVMQRLEVNTEIDFGVLKDNIADITAYTIAKYEYSKGVTLASAAKSKASREVHEELWKIAERMKKYRAQIIAEMFEAAEDTLEVHMQGGG